MHDSGYSALGLGRGCWMGGSGYRRVSAFEEVGGEDGGEAGGGQGEACSDAASDEGDVGG